MSSSFVSLTLEQHPPPEPLAPGWILRSSRSQPGNVYYYNQETGESSWDPPVMMIKEQESAVAVQINKQEEETTPIKQQVSSPKNETTPKETTQSETSSSPTKKRSAVESSFSINKRSNKSSSSSSSTPKQVRVLHILKKHKDSRRPSSWRQATITNTKEQARQELQELLGILQESTTPQEVRATMEELARTESDCSSAKRGGDLGFFGKKKMQPAFEQASFALEIGELSDLVETSSGVHIILRIG